MAGQFSLKTFLRKTPNRLLMSYLQQLGVGRNLGWEELGETQVERICEAIGCADERTRAKIACDFQRVHDMDDEGGVQSLLEEGRDRHHNVDLSPHFSEMESHIETAFWTFLHHPRVFETASQLHHANSTGGFHKRRDLPDSRPATDRETQDHLARALSDYYVRTQARGRACVVDHYSHDSRLYWFAYPEDYAVGRLIFDDSGDLQLVSERPAFEVIFVYATADHTLDTRATGGKRVRQELQRIFCSTILSLDIDFPDRTEVVYELDGLLNRYFPFAVRPEDGVEDVRVSRLWLRMLGSDNKRVTLEADVSENSEAVYDLLDDVLESQSLRRDRLHLGGVTIQVCFRATDTTSARKVSVRLTFPDSCDLKHQPGHDKVRELLKRWGIDVSGRSEDGAERPGRSVQRTLRV